MVDAVLAAVSLPSLPYTIKYVLKHLFARALYQKECSIAMLAPWDRKMSGSSPCHVFLPALRTGSVSAKIITAAKKTRIWFSL
jgi:hypothetical protein